MLRPYKFVKHDIGPLNDLKESRVYNLFERRRNLSRDDKDYLFSALSTNSYSSRGIPYLGWMFPFNDVLKTFLVKLEHYGWIEVNAPDKTSIRQFYGHSVIQIVHLAEKAA